MGYYDHYRGAKKQRRNRLRIALLILLLLIIFAIVALFFLQEQAVFTSDGFRFPFMKDDQTQQEEQSGNPDDVPLDIVGDDGSSAGTQPTDPQTPVTPDSPAATSTQAYLSMGAALLDNRDALLSSASTAGCGQLALQIKSYDGMCLLDDQSGAENSVSPHAADFQAALKQLDLPAIAVVSALRDGIRPRTVYRDAAVHTGSGATWLDYDYTSWFDPFAPQTAEYLKQLVSTCEAAGFQQVLLTNFHFPIRGKTSLISYNETATTFEALNTLAQTVSESANIPLSLLLTDDAVKNIQDGASGQDVKQLAQYFDILYVPADSFSVDVTALQDVIKGTDCRIGLYLTKQADPAGSTMDYILAGNAAD